MTEAAARLVRSLVGKPLPRIQVALRDFARASGTHGPVGPLTVEQKLLAALLTIPYQIPEVRAELPAEAIGGVVEREVYAAILAAYDTDLDEEDLDLVAVGHGLTTPEARQLVTRLDGHIDCIADDALRYARLIAAAWGESS